MSAGVLKEFLVSIGFQIDGEQQMQTSMGKATAVIAGVGAAAVAAGGAIFAFTKSVADEFDALGDLANRVNSTASELQELGYAAQLSGSSVEAATGSVERLASVAGQAAMGVGRGVKIFETIGVDVKGVNGELKNSTDLLWEVGDAIKDMERGQQLAVLEKLGIDKTMVDTLTSSVSGLREEFKSVYNSVGLDADKAAEASGDFMDSLDRLGFVVGAVGKSLAVSFMSRFTDAMNKLRRLIVENLPKIMSALKPTIALVLAVADVFVALAYRAGQAIGVVIGWLSKINDATGGWSTGILAAVAAWKYLNLAFLATPVGAVLALAAAIGVLIDDFLTWKEGGDSLIDWDSWKTEIDTATAVIEFFRDMIASSFNVMFAVIDAFISVFTGDFARAFRAIEEIMATFMASAGRVGSAIGSIASSVGGFFSSSDKPVTPAGATGANQSVSQNTTINVTGAADPATTAKAVSGAQATVNGDMARNLKGATR